MSNIRVNYSLMFDIFSCIKFFFWILCWIFVSNYVMRTNRQTDTVAPRCDVVVRQKMNLEKRGTKFYAMRFPILSSSNLSLLLSMHQLFNIWLLRFSFFLYTPGWPMIGLNCSEMFFLSDHFMHLPEPH